MKKDAKAIMTIPRDNGRLGDVEVLN